MKEITIVKISNPEKYKPYGQTYGILEDILDQTAIINWCSNMGGVCTNVAHEDYSIVPAYRWDVVDGEVIIPCYGGYIRTGLKVWR